MIILEYIAYIILTFCVSLLGLFITCKLLTPGFATAGRRARAVRLWMCRRMDWHAAPNEQGHDGCSANGCCPVCGRRVLLDSQGNWFSCSKQGDYKEPTP